MTRLILIVSTLILLCSALITAQTETETTSVTDAITVQVQVCSAIEERMPIDTVEVFPAGTEQVYAWCHVTGAVDSVSIWLDWYYGGELKAEVELPVKSSSWRTWSSKALLKSWTGEWEVRVLDSDKNILRSVLFFVGEKPAPIE